MCSMWWEDIVSSTSDMSPVQLLESARVEWRRDWDAVVIGFILGVSIGSLSVLALWLGWIRYAD
mgnify:FL=1